MSNKRTNKAYVRYDGNGRIVPGSLIINKTKPKTGDWVEIPAYDCCSGAVNCNSFWINQTFNPENVDNLYAVGSAMDSQCNSFILAVDYWTSPNNPNQASGQNFLLQKFNDAGDLVWNRVFDFAEDGVTFSYIDVQTINIDKEGNVICFLWCAILESSIRQTTVVKFDNDGNHIWSKVLFYEDPSGNSQSVINVVFDTSNNIYISLVGGGGLSNKFTNIKKISPDGSVLVSKNITLTDINNTSGQSYITVNSVGELYLITAMMFGSTAYIIKLDGSLNEIWNKSFTIGNYFPYGISLDKDENIVFQVGDGASSNIDALFGAYIKISPQGDLIWTTRISNTTDPDYSLGTFQLNSDADGNVYISSVYISDIPGYPGSDNSLIVAKLSPAGAFEWAYFVQPSFGASMDSWYANSPISGNVVNNSLILGYYDGNDPFNAQLLKLPLVPVADGVYGDYTFTNITNQWTTSSPEITLIDDVAIYEDGPITTEPLTYITFEGTYTTINTPL